jgi:hypothetical protein
VTRRRKLDPPPGEAWRLFPLVAWTPAECADAELELLELGVLRDRDRERDLLRRLREAPPGSTREQILGITNRSTGKLLTALRNRWIAMDYALRLHKREKPQDAIDAIANTWGVGSETAETARDDYYKLARRAIEEYTAGVSEDDALERMQYGVKLAQRVVAERGSRTPLSPVICLIARDIARDAVGDESRGEKRATKARGARPKKSR